MTDFTYSVYADNTVAIFPENDSAVKVWNGDIYPNHRGMSLDTFGVLAAKLRLQGFTVGVSPPITETDEELLAALRPNETKVKYILASGKPLPGHVCVVPDHSVRTFLVSVRTMSTVGPDDIKDQLQKKYEVTDCCLVKQLIVSNPR